MKVPDLLAALGPVVQALEELGVRHFIGGSLASSAHGVARTSIDVDLVAELGSQHVAPLVAALAPAYYVDEERVRQAVASRGSFNLVHLESMLKVDVFVSRGRPYDEAALRRARAEPLDEEPESRRYFLASAEDTVLAKLEWFRRGREASERQWSDVIGVLRASSGALDLAYLQGWAKELEVADLLERALREAGS